MKTCSKCLAEKPLEAFSTRKSKATGELAAISQCKQCVTLRATEWAANNKERRQAYLDQYKTEKKDFIAAGNAAYQAKNRELILAKNKQKYTENRQAMLAANAEWRALNPEKIAALKQRYYAANSEGIRASTLRYYYENRDAVAEASARRWASRPDEYRSERARHRREKHAANPESSRLYFEQYRNKNRPAYREARARYRATKLQATPAWADIREILEIYECAAAATELFGVPYHVDHIVPLRSELVCGLHVTPNLRVIPGVDNMSKKNRWWPDMP